MTDSPIPGFSPAEKPMHGSSTARDRGIVRTSMVANPAAARRYANVLLRPYWMRMPVLWSVFTVALMVIMCVAGGDQTAGAALATMIISVAIATLFIVGYAALLFLMTSSKAKQVMHDGAELTASFGPEAVGFSIDGMYSEVAFYEAEEVRLIGPTLVMYRARLPLIIVPGELVPPHVRDGIIAHHKMIRDRRPGTPQAGGGEPPVVERHPDGSVRARYVTDPELAGRVVRGMIGIRGLVSFGLFVIAVVVALIFISGLDPVVSIATVPATVIAMIVVWWNSRRRIRRLMPPGTPIVVDYLPDRIDIRFGGLLTSLPTRNITAVQFNSAAAILRNGRAALAFLPIEVVPDDIAEWLRTQVARQTAG